MKIAHGSLFSGFDAPSVAASWMGWENSFHCEINPFCNEILKYWFPNSEHYEDITKTDFRQWKGKIDVLTGGFPCQPFSLAGQRKGADDNRYLWPHMLRAIREIRPAWVIGENVAGILTMVQPGEEVEVGSQDTLFGEDNRKRILLRQEYVVETICKDLEREGYSVQPLLIPACAVEAPHRRDRVWFVARRLQDDCNEARERDNCGHRRLRFSESMGLEGEQFGVCVQNNQNKGRWKEMEDYLNAQIDLLCGAERRNRSHQQEQVRQPKVEFKNSFTLGELTQSLQRHRCEETKREEQMVCSNLREQQKISLRLLQYKRGSDSGKNQCGENTIAHCADSGTEDVRRKREDKVLSDRIAPDTNGYGYLSSGTCEESERCRCGNDGESKKRKQSPEWSDGLHGFPRNARGTLLAEWWQNFPTQSPVCRGNDGLPFDVDDLTIPFTKWRRESIKGYGNAIVPQVIIEIFKAIEEIEQST